MDLKGRTASSIRENSERLRVWYKEDKGGVKSRVVYAGRAVHFDPEQGLQVSFDGYPAGEEECITSLDEWE